MKFYNITLQRQPDGHLIYPLNYQSEVGDFAVDHMYYDTEKGEPRLLLAIEDVNAKDIVRANVEEVTELQASALSAQYEVRVEQVTDEAKVRRLAIKASLGQTFTTDELKAIDVNDPTPGFVMGKTFADRIADTKAIETLKVGK